MIFIILHIFFFNAIIAGKILLYSNDNFIITTYDDFDEMMSSIGTIKEQALHLLFENDQEIFNNFKENFIFDRVSFTIT